MSERASRRTLRCAIYTRKSSEEGLEQDFNSLQAQREACEAYVVSQKQEGWKVLPADYDDGGYSGGTLTRPALQRLLADIASGLIDIVVVYKVDRLTRALSDFARIVEVFDAQGVSFVSVTQQFNTTSSMGRLTLNVLLSFAQFEREVTGERIRDKIAASKKKGLWMGGYVPLGYRPDGRTLTIQPEEAEVIRTIFQLYLDLGSVAAVEAELARRNIHRPNTATISSGRSYGGRPFNRTAIYKLLSSPVYMGEISHKGERYPGQHLPIIDPDTWTAVRTQLAAHTHARHIRLGTKDPSLLAGLLHDDQGHRLTPTHAVKAGKRYRYYALHASAAQPRDGIRPRPSPSDQQQPGHSSKRVQSQAAAQPPLASQNAAAPVPSRQRNGGSAPPPASRHNGTSPRSAAIGHPQLDQPALPTQRWRIAATEIEDVVTRLLVQLLGDPHWITANLIPDGTAITVRQQVLAGARQAADRIRTATRAPLRETLLVILTRVVLAESEIRLHLRRSSLEVVIGRGGSGRQSRGMKVQPEDGRRLFTSLADDIQGAGESTSDALAGHTSAHPDIDRVESDRHFAGKATTSDTAADPDVIIVTISARFRRRGVETKLVIEAPGESPLPTEPDPALIKMVANARRWWEDLVAHRFTTMCELTAAYGKDERYVARILPLAFLAPSIIDAIVEGSQPPEMTSQQLITLPEVPPAWEDQRRVLA